MFNVFYIIMIVVMGVTFTVAAHQGNWVSMIMAVMATMCFVFALIIRNY